MACQRVGQRLARKLIDLGQRFGVETVRGPPIQARLTQQELAEMIGTTRETLAHTLSDFRRRDLLDTEHHQVVIRDAERLAEVAQDGEEPEPSGPDACPNFMLATTERPRALVVPREKTCGLRRSP